MKRYVILIFSMLMLPVLVISIVRCGKGLDPLDIKATTIYIRDNIPDFDTDNFHIANLVSGIEGAKWEYTAMSRDNSFLTNTANVFKNIGLFFLNIGRFAILVQDFITDVVVHIVLFVTTIFKIVPYFFN